MEARAICPVFEVLVAKHGFVSNVGQFGTGFRSQTVSKDGVEFRYANDRGDVTREVAVPLPEYSNWSFPLAFVLPRIGMTPANTDEDFLVAAEHVSSVKADLTDPKFVSKTIGKINESNKRADAALRKYFR